MDTSGILSGGILSSFACVFAGNLLFVQLLREGSNLRSVEEESPDEWLLFSPEWRLLQGRCLGEPIDGPDDGPLEEDIDDPAVGGRPPTSLLAVFLGGGFR